MRLCLLAICCFLHLTAPTPLMAFPSKWHLAAMSSSHVTAKVPSSESVCPLGTYYSATKVETRAQGIANRELDLMTTLEKAHRVHCSHAQFRSGESNKTAI